MCVERRKRNGGGDENERVLGQSGKDGECVHIHFRFLPSFTWPEVKIIWRKFFPDIPPDELFADEKNAV